MEILIPLLIIIIILGALLGGKNFGDTVRKGCGFLILLMIIIVAIILTFYSPYGFKKDTYKQETVSSSDFSSYFIVKQDCETYTKPNNKSEISGNLVLGQKLYIENVNKYKYFYELKNDSGKSYVKKEFLKRTY